MPPQRTSRERGRVTFGAVVLASAVTLLAQACGSSSPPSLSGSGDGQNDATAAGACAPPGAGCECSPDGASLACGEVSTRDGDYVTCTEGTRTCSGGTWGACVGQYTAIKSTAPLTLGGGIHVEGLQTDAGKVGACATNPCDPSCQGFVDTSTGLDAGPGLVPTDAGGWTLPLSMGDGGKCVNLQCQVPSCDGGATTTVTGTVYDPAALNPVYNAIVMIPNGTVQPIPAGVSSDQCGGAPLPLAVSYAYSATDGTFTLTGVPIGASIPLVIQQGRWRRVTTINTSALSCGGTLNISKATGCLAPHPGLNNYAGTAGCATRLPRKQSEGNIPAIAIATGGLDAIECMLYRMGVSSSEYTDETGTGRVNIFHDGGATLASPALNHDASYLLGFSCPHGQCPSSGSTSTTNVANPSFETGTLASWTASGSYVAASNAGGTATAGSWSASLGSGAVSGSCVTSNTNSLKQTFTAPAGATGFEMDMLEFCANVKNGQAGASISFKDNTANATQSCSSCNWNSATTCDFNVTPGHSYTVTLTNADPSNSGYCTQTFFDNARWWSQSTVPSLLNNYDLVMLPCDGGGEYNSVNWGASSYDDPGRVNLVSYAGVGGRVFSSHWGREWIERTSANLVNGPFPGVANWISDASGNSATGVINTGASWGVPFDAWMISVGATAGTTITINPQREDTSSVNAPTQTYVSYQADGDPADFVFNTPFGSSSPVGRVMYTDMHLANGTPSGTFPGNCPTQGGALSQQEDAAEYLLFDLGGCVSGQPPPGNPTQYNPATFTRDYQAVCPSGQQPVWRYFYWRDATPSDSSIQFTAYTADTQAQLGTEFPAAPLATATGPDNCPTGPSCATSNVGVDVDPKLQQNGTPTSKGNPPIASHAWLRVVMGLNPSTDKQSTPALLAWQQDYDCVAAE